MAEQSRQEVILKAQPLEYCQQRNVNTQSRSDIYPYFASLRKGFFSDLTDHVLSRRIFTPEQERGAWGPGMWPRIVSEHQSGILLSGGGSGESRHILMKLVHNHLPPWALGPQQEPSANFS